MINYDTYNVSDYIKLDKRRYNGFKSFINTLHSRLKEFDYHSGYTHSDKPVNLICKKCNFIITRAAQVVRNNKKTTCENCIRINKEQEEQYDNMIKDIVSKLDIVILNKTSLKTVRVCTCLECSKVFSNKRKINYCSDKCKNKKKNRMKEIRKRLIYKDNGKIDKDISIDKLMEKHDGICYLCNESCDIEDCRYDENGNFIVGLKYPSIEHVIPVSKGGTHTWDNVNLAHLSCNSKKGNK